MLAPNRQKINANNMTNQIRAASAFPAILISKPDCNFEPLLVIVVMCLLQKKAMVVAGVPE